MTEIGKSAYGNREQECGRSPQPVFVEGQTLDDCWHQLLWQCAEKGRRYRITNGSFAGAERVALDFASGFVHFPHTRPLAPMVPEYLSIARPATDESIEQYFVNYLLERNLEEGEHYKYGSWISGGTAVCEVRQLDWIIEHLRENEGNEHCWLSVGGPEWLLAYDKPFRVCKKCARAFGSKLKGGKCPFCLGELEDREELRGTSPCLRGLDFRIIDGALLTHVVYRSWDLYSGWPTNMGGFALLNEYVAGEVGVKEGPLAFSCKSLHLYDFQLQAVGCLLRRDLSA